MAKRRRKRRVTFRNPIHKPHGAMSPAKFKRLMDKINLNSFYPHQSAAFSKFYDPELASAITISGQIIGRIISMELNHNARSLELRENL